LSTTDRLAIPDDDDTPGRGPLLGVFNLRQPSPALRTRPTEVIAAFARFGISVNEMQSRAAAFEMLKEMACADEEGR
jgi:hypothetical protein